uniref:Cyclic nucleotide-binding domain-containing protein n=1 Tax=Haptolina brevifila TaxID=156173 RepID=A0A7S2IU48_9EUKA
MSSFVFAFAVGEISSTIVSMDWHGKMKDEKMDALRDFARWRNLSPDLEVRMSQYFENYYTSKPVFDEQAILDKLSPGLKVEVVHAILSRTIGRLPLFSTKLDRRYQARLFPYLHPMSFSAGDVIFHKGERSESLSFLLEGQVDAFALIESAIPAYQRYSIEKGEQPIDDDISTGPTVTIPGPTPVPTVTILDEVGHPIVEMASTGCIGAAVLLDARQMATLRARTLVNILYIKAESPALGPNPAPFAASPSSFHAAPPSSTVPSARLRLAPPALNDQGSSPHGFKIARTTP